MRPALAAAAMLCAAGAALAEPRRLMDEAEAADWRAVGRLNAAGMQFCTAVLIAPDRVLTADHCLTNGRTGTAFRMQALKFVAGHRKGGHAALRAVRRAGRLGPAEGSDLALLELAEPIDPADVAAIPVVEALAAATIVVSYGRDRAHAPSIARDCRATPAGLALVALDCPAAPGMSGAPAMVQTPDGPAIIGIVSFADEAGRAYAAAVGPVLATLERRLSQTP